MATVDDSIGPVQEHQFYLTLQKNLTNQYALMIKDLQYMESTVEKETSAYLPGRIKLIPHPGQMERLYKQLSEEVIDRGISLDKRPEYIFVDMDEHILLNKRILAKQMVFHSDQNFSSVGPSTFKSLLLAMGFPGVTVTEKTIGIVTVTVCTQLKCLKLMEALDQYRENGITYSDETEIDEKFMIDVSINPEVNYQSVYKSPQRPIDRISFTDFKKLSNRSKVIFLTEYLDPEILSEVLKNTSTGNTDTWQEICESALMRKMHDKSIVLVKSTEPVVIEGNVIKPKIITIDELLQD